MHTLPLLPPPRPPALRRAALLSLLALSATACTAPPRDGQPAARAVKIQVSTRATLPAGKAAKPKPRPKPAVKAPTPPRPLTHQFFTPDDMLIQLSSVTDRSGRTWPDIGYSSPGDENTPQTITGLDWSPAPGGMTYREEILGSWHGIQILASHYHHAEPTTVDGYVEETTMEVVSFAAADGIMHPFFCAQSDSLMKTSAPEFLPPGPGRKLPVISIRWHYSGTGGFSGTARFTLHPDGPHLQSVDSGGRHMPGSIQTYDLSGRLRATRLVWN